MFSLCLLRPIEYGLRGFVLASMALAGGPAFPATTPVEAGAVRAQLTPRRHALVSAEIGAKISRFCVPEGGSFKEGELLIQFDATLQRAQVERAEAALAAAQKTATANERLLELRSVGQVEAENSQSDLRKARADLALASAMLAKCEIRAPFSGRLSEQRAREQEFVQPGQPLFEIIDDEIPQIDFIAPSKWLSWLRPGHPLEIRIEETGQTYPATIERIGARVDPVSQSVKIVARFSGQHAELMAGMSGTIAIAPKPKA